MPNPFALAISLRFLTSRTIVYAKAADRYIPNGSTAAALDNFLSMIA